MASRFLPAAVEGGIACVKVVVVTTTLYQGAGWDVSLLVPLTVYPVRPLTLVAPAGPQSHAVIPGFLLAKSHSELLAGGPRLLLALSVHSCHSVRAARLTQVPLCPLRPRLPRTGGGSSGRV